MIGPIADPIPPWIMRIDEIYEKLTEANQRQFLAKEIEFGIQIQEYRIKLMSKQIENAKMLIEMVKKQG